MRRISALFPTILSLAFLPLLNAAELTGVWKADGTNTPHSSPEAPGEAAVTVRFPGSAQLYREPDRATFRPSREAFEAAEFELEARVITDTPDPVRAWLFFKDKDGRWYQTIEEYRLAPGVWQKLSARWTAPARSGAASGIRRLSTRWPQPNFTQAASPSTGKKSVNSPWRSATRPAPANGNRQARAARLPLPGTGRSQRPVPGPLPAVARVFQSLRSG